MARIFLLLASLFPFISFPVGVLSRGWVAPPPTTPSYAGTGCTASNGGAYGTTISCTVTGITTGQTIVGTSVIFSNTLLTAAVTDSGSNGGISTPVSPYLWDSGNDNSMGFVVKNLSAGSHTITVTWSASAPYADIWVLVLNNASTSSPVDSSSSFSQNAASPIQCGNVTTSANNELLVGFVAGDGGVASVSGGTVPQTMTNALNIATNDMSFYGTATTAGTNYAEATYTGSVVMCNLFAIH